VTVYVEDKFGDVGTPGSSPFWLSPDVDIPAHSGQAVQGSNNVQIRVHANDEPVLEEKIATEVYVGQPGFVLSPTVGTKRIDPGNLLFRTNAVPGTEPVANVAGGTASFPWTPSSAATDIDGPGHRCLLLRAFPVSVTPPGTPFDVPNEQHEAQHNIEVLTTTKEQGDMISGGAGVPRDPRKRERDTGLWWERLVTMGVGTRRGKRFIAWAFDPDPSDFVLDSIRNTLKRQKIDRFHDSSIGPVSIEPEGTFGTEISPKDLLSNGTFVEGSGIGGRRGLFTRRRMLGAAMLELGPKKVSSFVLRFDLSSLDPKTAVVLHGAQWDENGRAEGGMTIVAIAPK
jgi:hypothetical protein